MILACEKITENSYYCANKLQAKNPFQVRLEGEMDNSGLIF
jgi:hypothetical protein